MWRRARVHAGFLLLPGLGLAARRAATGAWLPPAALDRGRYLATQVAAYPLYLVRAAIPVDPAFYRGHPPAPWPPDAATVLGWVARAGRGRGGGRLAEALPGLVARRRVDGRLPAALVVDRPPEGDGGGPSRLPGRRGRRLSPWAACCGGPAAGP